MAGADSQPWFHENVRLLAGMVPGAETLMLPGLTHLAPVTHPAEPARVIAGFLGRTPAHA